MDSISTSSELGQSGSGPQEHIASHLLRSPDEFGRVHSGVSIEAGTQSTTSSSGQTSADRSYELISIPTTPSISTSALPPSSPPLTLGKRDLAIAVDGSYVETTSATAARVLAKFYSEQDGGGKGKEEYVVVSRQERGKTFWRIRPRSRPAREEAPVPKQPANPSSSRPFVPPLLFPSLSSPPSKTNAIPTPPPTLTFQQPTPVKSSTAARPWRNLRSSKSIPVLRSGIIPIATPITRSPKISQESTAASAWGSRQQLKAVPVVRSTTKGETFRRLRRVGSTPILSNEIVRSEKKSPVTRLDKGKGKEVDSSRGDILGNLLGWNVPSASKGKASAPTSPRAGEALSTREQALKASHSFLATTSIPPFQFPAKPTPSTSLLSPSAPEPQARHMREVASNDSIRTAKADDEPVRVLPTRKRFQDPAIFDLFQSESLSRATRDSHHRIPSRSSSTSDMFRSDPHLISVPSKETDDPRFVLWGYKDLAPTPSLRSPTSPARSATARRGSVEGGGSSSSMSGGSPATGSSRRWSLNGRKPFGGGGETSSPATSIRDSISSIVGLSPATARSPSTKVLMAATVERLVAELTSKIEVELLSGFFLTYRSFVRPLDLLRLLITRFEWAMQETNSPEDEAGRRIVRVRTFVVLRHWLLNHFADDFIPERKLRTTLTDWLNAASKEERIRESPKDMRLIKGLKKLVRKLKELHVALGPDDTEAAARALAGSQLDEVGGGVRATGEEDVDLELEQATRIPPANLAPAPTSALASATISFLSKKTRTPQSITSSPTAFEVPPPQLHSPSSNPNFPLPNSQNPISRSVTSALGTFGRFRRMLGNRTNHAPASTLRTCASSEAFDEVEFEENATGDLLWVKGGLERYLAFYDIDKDEDYAVGLQSTEEEAPPQVEKVVGGLGIMTTFELEKEDYVAINKPAFIPAFKPYPPKSILSRVSHGGPPKLSLPPAPYGAGDHSSDIFFLQPRPTSARIELDDVDLSDEDDDVVEVKRTLKRLPGAQNLRQAITLQNLVQSGVTRHSFDSVSSYGSPHGRPSLMSRGSMVDSEGGDVPEGVQVVPNFVLEGIDSDDEEPGDVEAALRRLEGIVDDGKEAAKAQKVAMQMEKSRQLEILKMSLVSVEDDASNTPQLDSPSARASIGPLNKSITSSLSQSTIASLPSVPESEDYPRHPDDQSTREAVVLVGPVSLIPPDRHISELGSLSPTPRHPASSPQVPRKPSFSKLFSITSRPPSARPSLGLAPPTHRSFLLTCRTEVLAQQFCLIERDMLRVLGWQELVGGTWSDRSNVKEVVDWELYLKERRIEGLKARQNGDRSGSGVEAVIARFNLTANWVCSEIVLTASIEDRVALISKFIRLAFKCYCQSNFQTLTQIIHGLQSEDLERLRKTWDRVPTWEMRKFRNMQLFVSHLKNFKLLREVTNSLISEYGPPGQRTTSDTIRSPSVRGGKAPAPTGCIPFLGLYLRDLTINAELPTFLDPTCTTAPASIDANGSLISPVDPLAFASLPPLPPQTNLQPLVNLHKFRTMASVVQCVLAFQEFAEGYPYTPEQGVYFKCLKIRCLNPGFIRECSLRLAQE